MTPTIIFYIIIVFLVLSYLRENIFSLLNLRYAQTHPLPQEISDLYDPDKRALQLNYQRSNTHIHLVTECVSFLAILLMLCLGGFAWLNDIVCGWTDNNILQALYFYGIIYLAQYVYSIPISAYDTFVIEQKFGFNRTTPKTFVTDTIKTIVLNVVLLGVILLAIVLIYNYIPEWFWLLAWAVVTFFTLFIGQFYSNLIVPLFNKQTPLPDGELRTAIEQFAKKVDFKLDNIYVLDESKRSSKSNAYFTGWGKRKRIVLYDTLINTMTTEEIVSVLAHEIGHSKHHHTLKSIISSSLLNLIMFALLGIILKYDIFAQAIGCETASFHINMLVFALLYTPISTILEFCENISSRRHEYQADHFVKENGMAQHLITSLKKLTTDNLSNPIPHPVVVFCLYSHPTLYQRIKALKEDEKH
ncbi:MAG: M48 family metallopeptidase [Paludibacteraceae bacterium]|nr:M48 family metallopeptidase [Paludibacteraceae bacterium]